MFFSADGLDFTRGVTTKEYQLADIKKAMLRNANKKILLIDSSKISVYAVQYVAALEEIDAVIVDSGISRADEQTLRQLVPQVVIARLG